MEEKKKNSVGKIVLIIILLILFLTGGFFGGKYYAESKKVDSKEVKEEKEVEGEEKLDINSRLVQYLYNMVSYDSEISCFTDWEYRRNENFIHDDNKTVEINLNILAKNISNLKAKYIEKGKVPKVEGKSLPANSGYIKCYTKEYIELVYKTIFGQDAKLDVSKAIPLDQHSIQELIYDSNTNMYYLYTIEGGGTCGPGGLELKLDKAIKKGKNLKIYQNVTSVTYKENADGSITEDEKNKVEEKYKYVYTFELEDDGMYKFVSRVKEK